MAGASYVYGEQKTRPGVYVRTVNVGEPSVAEGAQGIGAATVQASWGPLNEVVSLEGIDDVTDKFGVGQGTNVLRELFRGGALEVKAVRLGSGGEPASVSLKDETDEDVVHLTTKYPTSRNFNVTVRDTLADPTVKELLVFEGTRLLETVTFQDVDGLVEGVNNGAYLTAVKRSDGNIVPVVNESLTGGSDPTVTGEDYTEALKLLEAETWNIVVTDTDDPVIHASLNEYVNRLVNDGKRILGVVGEKPDVPFETREQNAKSFNNPFMIYVGNGKLSAFGEVVGAEAAARVAGEILRSAYNDSLTHRRIEGAVDVVGKLTNREIERAIKAGMIVFTRDASGNVQIEAGVTTFTQPDDQYDLGWSKIRRTRTRNTLIDRIVRAVDPLVGKINNDANGVATIVAIANGIINEMIAEGGLLDGSAEVTEFSADSAWFKIGVDDLDSLERAYFEFGFRYAPES